MSVCPGPFSSVYFISFLLFMTGRPAELWNVFKINAGTRPTAWNRFYLKYDTIKTRNVMRNACIYIWMYVCMYVYYKFWELTMRTIFSNDNNTTKWKTVTWKEREAEYGHLTYWQPARTIDGRGGCREKWWSQRNLSILSKIIWKNQVYNLHKKQILISIFIGMCLYLQKWMKRQQKNMFVIMN